MAARKKTRKTRRNDCYLSIAANDVLIFEKSVVRAARNFKIPLSFSLSSSFELLFLYLVSMVAWSVLGIEKIAAYTTSFP